MKTLACNRATVRQKKTVAAILSKTKTIPIVLLQVTDPVGSEFVTGLARPGGNVTGFGTFDHGRKVDTVASGADTIHQTGRH